MDTTNWNQESKDALIELSRLSHEVFTTWAERYGTNEKIDQELRDAVAYDKETAYCRYVVTRDDNQGTT